MTTGIDKKTGKGGMNLFMLILLFAISYPVIVYAQETLVIQRPTNAGIRDAFRMRDAHPITGRRSPHKGVDYAVPCGTTFQPRYGGTLSCAFQGSPPVGTGWGRYGNVSHQCGVLERYAHLQACGGGSMTSGGARGMAGAGGSTGCHLHYELRIDGVAVDPEYAYGKNLCDPAVRRDLVEDAQRKLEGRAGGGGGTGTPPTAPGGGGNEPPPGVPNETPVVGPIPPTEVEELVPTVEETDNPPTACDIGVWRGMVNLAVLQTRREMLLNETFVAKPDSVLAYACIADMWDSMGQNGGVYSETQAWRNRQINILNGGTATVDFDPSSYTLDSAIGSAALSAYDAYMNRYFDHLFLGEITTVPVPPPPPPDPNAPPPPNDPGDDEDPNAIDQAYTPCGIMANVWQMAKCKNVDDGSFPAFATLIGSDPRLFPRTLQCNDSGIAQTMIDKGKQTGIPFSPIVLNLELLDSTFGDEDDGGGAGGGGAGGDEEQCHTPIVTGVTVERRQGEGRITERIVYQDGLCITAGCTFVRGEVTVLGENDPVAPFAAQTGEAAGTCVIAQP